MHRNNAQVLKSLLLCMPYYKLQAKLKFWFSTGNILDFNLELPIAVIFLEIVLSIL